jgi:uncharacterized SAM-binding protein YcdF (DUF218 family)
VSEGAFFLASKLVWFVAAPTNLMALLVAGGGALAIWARTRVLGRRAVAAGVMAFLISALLPIGDWLLLPLERRFPELGECRFDGVILLGGSIGATEVNGAIEEDLNEAVDRVRYAASLARQNPDAPVLISGGQTFPREGARSEAEAMAQLLHELGVPRERLQLETASRTTSENARELSGDDALSQRRWALVTSAFHMPRAVGVFRREGIDVVAAPTDWRVDLGAPLMTWSVSGRLTNLDLAAKEYVGLIAYRIAGRTDALLPAPREDCAAGT